MQKHHIEENILRHNFVNRPFFMVDHVTWKLEDTFFYIFMHSYSFKFLGCSVRKLKKEASSWDFMNIIQPPKKDQMLSFH